MIEFVSEETRTQFHLLPAELQKIWEKLSISFVEQGYSIKLYFVDQPQPGSLEISIRINKEFEPTPGQLDLPGFAK